MKTYKGVRSHGFASVSIMTEGEPSRALPPRFDLRKHSPDGFEWGYGGSGPAQLALAICADALQDDERAQRIYQDFKARAVEHFHGDHWTMTEEEVRAAVGHIEQRRQLQHQATEGGQQSEEQPKPLTPEEGRAAAVAMTEILKARGFSEEEQKLAAVLDTFRRGHHDCPEDDPRARKALEVMLGAFSYALTELCEARGVDVARVMTCSESLLGVAAEYAMKKHMQQPHA